MPSRGGSKGKIKPKITDLSRTHPNAEEFEAVMKLLATTNASPIAIATLGASMVEIELERTIRERLGRQDDATWKRLTAENGPLNTLHQKTEIAYALKIINSELHSELGIIRTIRNAFAHAKRVFDFNHELISKEMSQLKRHSKTVVYRTTFKGVKPTPRHIFILACAILMIHFRRRDKKIISLKARRMLKKRVGVVSQELLAMSYPEPKVSNPESPAPHSQAAQSDDPKKSTR